MKKNQYLTDLEKVHKDFSYVFINFAD